MTSLAVWLLAFLAAIFISPVRAEEAPDLAAVVTHLGLNTKDPIEGFDALAKSPVLATPLLVQQLHPIKRGTYFEGKKSADALHVFACLRALRYLTGRTFSATTSAELNDDEKQFLDFDKEMHDKNPDHKLHFFGLWMSRNAEYVAPEDAQKKIIEQWQDFADHKADGLKDKVFAPAGQSMNDWYWFG